MSSFDLTKPDPCLTTVFAAYHDGKAANFQWEISWGKSFSFRLYTAKGGFAIGGKGLNTIRQDRDADWLIRDLAHFDVHIDKNTALTTIHCYMIAVTGEKHPLLPVPANFRRQVMDAPSVTPV